MNYITPFSVHKAWFSERIGCESKNTRTGALLNCSEMHCRKIRTARSGILPEPIMKAHGWNGTPNRLISLCTSEAKFNLTTHSHPNQFPFAHTTKEAVSLISKNLRPSYYTQPCNYNAISSQGFQGRAQHWYFSSEICITCTGVPQPSD